MGNKTPVKKEEVRQEVSKTKVATAEKVEPKKDIKPTSASKPEAKKPLTLANLQKELETLKQAVQDHTQLIADLQGMLALKRRPTSNSKVQIKDKQTGKVYPSKNNCYQSLLRAGELKELVDKGIFGLNPERNNFGWFALVRTWPDRFEEVKAEPAAERERKDDSGKPTQLPSNKGSRGGSKESL